MRCHGALIVPFRIFPQEKHGPICRPLVDLGIIIIIIVIGQVLREPLNELRPNQRRFSWDVPAFVSSQTASPFQSFVSINAVRTQAKLPYFELGTVLPVFCL